MVSGASSVNVGRLYPLEKKFWTMSNFLERIRPQEIGIDSQIVLCRIQKNIRKPVIVREEVRGDLDAVGGSGFDSILPGHEGEAISGQPGNPPGLPKSSLSFFRDKFSLGNHTKGAGS